MSLLLLERSKPGDPLFELAPSGPEEQYRFHFDMTKCIGCRYCEVACAEQNGNPLEINWRRVGEIEGGEYPYAQRFYVSMGCNHCLDPSCLTGCPTDAYNKDTVTRLVLHSADACIGCGFCTWNCQYGVPQYNPERGVVGKCDMCHGRLSEGREPACVGACPEGAIEVELVNIAEWRLNYEAANAPGMPVADHTISTTRITLPDNISPNLKRADYHRVRPEDPHLPLVFMLVLTQLSAGAFLYLALLHIDRPTAVAAALIVAFLSLAASTLHLGRPIYAWRALRMWRRSWLSREVLLFSLFSIVATGSIAVPALSPAAAILGFAGVTASAFIYLAPARPAWNSRHTVADFYLTALLLGPLFLAVLRVPVSPILICVAAAGQLLNQSMKLIQHAMSEEFELRASTRLLAHDFRRSLYIRIAQLVGGGVILPWLHQPVAAFVLALAGEMLSRYLFFVSVVQKNMASSFFGKEAA